MKLLVRNFFVVFTALFIISCSNAADASNLDENSVSSPGTETGSNNDSEDNNTSGEEGGTSGGNSGTPDENGDTSGEDSGTPGESGGSSGGDNGDSNGNTDTEIPVIPDGYTVIKNDQLNIDLKSNNGHALSMYLREGVSGSWNIINGVFVGSQATLTLAADSYDYSQIRLLIAQAITFTNTTVTSMYPTEGVDNQAITSSTENVLVQIHLEAAEGYIFENGKTTKELQITFAIIVK